MLFLIAITIIGFLPSCGPLLPIAEEAAEEAVLQIIEADVNSRNSAPQPTQQKS